MEIVGQHLDDDHNRYANLNKSSLSYSPSGLASFQPPDFIRRSHL